MALTVILPSGLSNTGNFAVGSLSATGNLTGNYILGNGALLTGVITSVANINNGTSNVTVVSSGGNVTVGVGGTSNVAVFATTGVFGTQFYATNGFLFNQSTIASSVVFPTGYNASTVGPITQSPGATVTVSAGSKWIVFG